VNRIRRRVSAAVNPVSTTFTRWWCHSALRRMVTGHGPTARQRRLIRNSGPGPGLSSEQIAEAMRARARALDEILRATDGHDM